MKSKPIPPLKGCPLCGGEAKVQHWQDGEPFWSVYCEAAESHHVAAFGNTKSEAAARWNRRK